MDSCDVLIVGGGPAGSSCAWALRSSGLDVLVLDKSRFPRNKVCGGWITLPVLSQLEIEPQCYADGRTLQPITGFRVSCMEQKEVDVPYGEPVSYGIRRCEFDDYLLKRSGARLCQGTSIRSVERSDDGWIVNGEIRTRLLVGAGGHFCPVSKALGNKNSENPVVAQEIEFEMDARQAAGCKIQSEVPELYFCRDLQGYAWCFRKNNFLNIGLGRLDQHALSEHVGHFIEWLRDAGKLTFDLPRRLSGHAYLLYGCSKRKLVDDSVLLIGDAAGLAYMQSGEGIRPAVESGLLAAKAIKAANGKYRRERLNTYQEVLAARFGDGNSWGSRITRSLPHGVRNGLARVLLKNKSFCRSVVVEKWFLRGEAHGS